MKRTIWLMTILLAAGLTALPGCSEDENKGGGDDKKVAVTPDDNRADCLYGDCYGETDWDRVCGQHFSDHDFRRYGSQHPHRRHHNDRQTPHHRGGYYQDRNYGYTYSFGNYNGCSEYNNAGEVFVPYYMPGCGMVCAGFERQASIPFVPVYHQSSGVFFDFSFTWSIGYQYGSYNRFGYGCNINDPNFCECQQWRGEWGYCVDF